MTIVDEHIDLDGEDVEPLEPVSIDELPPEDLEALYYGDDETAIDNAPPVRGLEDAQRSLERIAAFEEKLAEETALARRNLARDALYIEEREGVHGRAIEREERRLEAWHRAQREADPKFGATVRHSTGSSVLTAKAVEVVVEDENLPLLDDRFVIVTRKLDAKALREALDKRIKAELKTPGAFVAVATDDGEPLGTPVGFIRPEPRWNRKEPKNA